MYLKPGKIINERYEVMNQLGSGGFGNTYLVKDIKDSNSKLVVVKEIIPKANTQLVLQRVIQRFKREVKALKKLGRHPNIPCFFETFIQEKKLYLVQEYIEGHDLSEEFNQSLSESEVIKLLKDVLEILRFVHQNKVIHRDIKPSNLMRRQSDQQIMLIDFGAVKEISSMEDNEESPQARTIAIGTSGYMAPEQKNGHPRPNSDIYAVGMIAIQALTGLSPNSLHRDSQTGEIKWRNWTNVNDSLANILDRMILYSFRERYQSADQILIDLARIETINKPISNFKFNFSLKYFFPKIVFSFPLNVILILSFSLFLLFIKIFNKPDTCPLIFGDDLSCGEEILTKEEILPEKREGVEAFAEGKYQEAILWLEKARSKKINDPEILIYLNNAKLIVNKTPFYTIAVTAPVGDLLNTDNIGKEILRGVAQVQTNVNEGNKINGFGLRVLIADDYDLPDYADKIAKRLVQQPDILAVIGHATSDATIKTLNTYRTSQLVLISPTSTAEKLSVKSDFFFRTVPRNSKIAYALSKYLIQELKQTKAAIFYTSKSEYTQSLNQEFLRNYDRLGGQIVKQVDLSQTYFNAEESLNNIKQREGSSLIFFPDAKGNSLAFSKILKVIRANKNSYFMLGGDSLYSRDILQEGELANNLIAAIPWHFLNSSNPEFNNNAKKFWGENVTWRTATSFDATIAIVKALETQNSLNLLESIQANLNPSIRRKLVQQSLANPQFKILGATGEIAFEITGDRLTSLNNLIELVKVVPYSCSPYGYTFIPIKYSNPQEAGLNCE